MASAQMTRLPPQDPLPPHMTGPSNPPEPRGGDVRPGDALFHKVVIDYLYKYSLNMNLLLDDLINNYKTIISTDKQHI